MSVIKTLLQIGFICALSMIGGAISSFFHLPLPGNLIGLFLLLMLLYTGLLKEEHIQQGSDLLLKYMAFFFIPAGVDLLAYLGLLRDSWLSWLLAILLTTLVVMLSTGKVMDALIKKGDCQ